MSNVERLQRLLALEDLSETEAGQLLRDLASDQVPAALAGGLLIALRNKGEVATELRGFATAMRALARRPQLTRYPALVDIVGTGGDGSHSLNLSTGSALLAAACGLKVVKHGNRSVSSRSGSADLLTQLGLPIPLDEAATGRCLDELGFTFLFAPYYHPAMKAIAPVRAALGVRTVFNVLGPLTNPAAPGFLVIGAFSESMAALMAETLAGMDIERAFVVHGAAGWDEATPIGPYVCFDVRPERVVRSVRDPADVGFARCRPEDLRGGEAAENAARLAAALRGADHRAHRDALVLGAALALEVTGAEADLEQAVARAGAVLESGAPTRLLERLATFK